ncbi:MAG TPA: hypothetical protein VG435_06075 [Acidimicrobiales bacterium]|jgi:hypothetical protein|nr:hypothetical protein [Acidimicrobiales bacterium]
MKEIFLAVGGLGILWLLVQSFATRLTVYLIVLPFLTWLQIHVPSKEWTLVPSVLVILTAAVAIGLPPLRSGARLSRPAKGLTILVLLYGGLAAAEAFNPYLPSVTLGVRGARLILEPLLLYFIGAEVARRPELTSRVIKILIGTGVVVAAYGLKQAFLGFDHRESLYYISNFQDVTLHEQRVFSTMAGASVFGNYMALIAFLAVGLIINGSRRVISLSILVAVCGIDMLVTGQRGVIVGALGGVLVTGGMALIRRSTRRRGVRMAQALTLLVAVLVGMVVTTPVQQRNTLLKQHESAFQAARLKLALLKEPSQDSSISNRETRLTELGSALEKVPLGAGAGLNLLVGGTQKASNQYLLGSGGYGGPGYKPPVPAIPDELYYYNLGSELGLAGLVLFCVIMLFGLIAAVGIGVRHPDSRKATIAFGAAGFLTLIIIDSFTVDSMTAVQVASYFWLFIGMVGRWSQEDRRPGRSWSEVVSARPDKRLSDRPSHPPALTSRTEVLAGA